MKKTITKILSLVIGMMLIMSIVTMADPTTVEISVPSTDNHTYNVYQIFTGELADGVLSNVHWGKNGTGTEGQVVPKATLDAVAAITGTDGQMAAVLKTYADLTGDPAYTVSKGAAINVPTGYYLIKDVDETALAQGDEATLYIVKVVGPTEIARKAGTTQSDKKLDDINDSTGVKEELQTSSDYDIGDYVPYHLTAKLSSKVEQYHKYHITFQDTLEAGKFDDITDPVIKMNGKDVANGEGYTVTTTYNTTPTKAGFKVTIEFTAPEGATLPASLNEAQFTIDFTAQLGQGAAIGSKGNKNTLHVSYSNNPNDIDGGDEGTTPDKVVITFTYKVVVNKVDQDQKPLDGAQFALYKVAETYALPTTGDAKSKGQDAASNKIDDYTAVITGTKNDIFTFKGLDDGRYVLVETVTPKGYNTIDPQVFDVVATHGGSNNDALTLDTLTGSKVSGDITFTRDTSDEDALKATIKNEKGTTLPETGGMGTTIFYVIGGILVLAAAIILISRRRVQQ